MRPSVNAGERYRAVWFDLQTARDKPDPAKAFNTVLTTLDIGVQQMLPDIGPPADHSQLLAEGFGYRESGPHLMLMAFLQRVINGGGRVEREYGLGRGALDLVIEWRGARHAIEVKLRRDTETEADALEQVGRYLDTSGLEEGRLVMFDLRSTVPWEERLSSRLLEVNGKRVHVVGC